MKRNGFTLIEILVVVTLLSMVSLAVFTCFSNGLRLWARVQGLGVEEDVVIFFDRFTLDAANAFLFSTLELEGGDTFFSFPAVVYTKTDAQGSRAGEGHGDQIGRIRYSFDASAGRILREEADYGRALRGEFVSSRVVVSGVKGLKFLYYYPDQADTAVTFRGDGILPSGVAIEVSFSGRAGQEGMDRYVAIPAGA